jgi:hypothetical protein
MPNYLVISSENSKSEKLENRVENLDYELVTFNGVTYRNYKLPSSDPLLDIKNLGVAMKNISFGPKAVTAKNVSIPKKPNKKPERKTPIPKKPNSSPPGIIPQLELTKTNKKSQYSFESVYHNLPRDKVIEILEEQRDKVPESAPIYHNFTELIDEASKPVAESKYKNVNQILIEAGIISEESKYSLLPAVVDIPEEKPEQEKLEEKQEPPTSNQKKAIGEYFGIKNSKQLEKLTERINMSQNTNKNYVEKIVKYNDQIEQLMKNRGINRNKAKQTMIKEGKIPVTFTEFIKSIEEEPEEEPEQEEPEQEEPEQEPEEEPEVPNKKPSVKNINKAKKRGVNSYKGYKSYRINKKVWNVDEEKWFDSTQNWMKNVNKRTAKKQPIPSVPKAKPSAESTEEDPPSLVKARETLLGIKTIIEDFNPEEYNVDDTKLNFANKYLKDTIAIKSPYKVGKNLDPRYKSILEYLKNKIKKFSENEANLLREVTIIYTKLNEAVNILEKIIERNTTS